MDAQTLAIMAGIGAAMSPLFQMVKSEKWGKYFTAAVLAAGTLAVVWLTTSGSDADKLVKALTTLTAMIATHSLFLQSTPVGGSLKVGLWDQAVSSVSQVVSGVMKAIQATHTPPKA